MHTQKLMSLVQTNLFNCMLLSVCKDGQHSDNNNNNVVVLPVTVKWCSLTSVNRLVISEMTPPWSLNERHKRKTIEGSWPINKDVTN